jgi:hypothetical protein
MRRAIENAMRPTRSVSVQRANEILYAIDQCNAAVEWRRKNDCAPLYLSGPRWNSPPAPPFLPQSELAIFRTTVTTRLRTYGLWNRRGDVAKHRHPKSPTESDRQIFALFDAPPEPRPPAPVPTSSVGVRVDVTEVSTVLIEGDRNSLTLRKTVKATAVRPATDPLPDGRRDPTLQELIEVTRLVAKVPRRNGS